MNHVVEIAVADGGQLGRCIADPVITLSDSFQAQKIAGGVEQGPNPTLPLVTAMLGWANSFVETA
jgi:hypothetical protein